MADPERVPVDQRHRDEVVLHHPAGPGRPDIVHRPPPARIPADAEMARPVRRRADGDHGSAGRGNLLDPRLARTRGPTVRHRTRRVPPRPPRSDADLVCRLLLEKKKILADTAVRTTRLAIIRMLSSLHIIL